MSQIEVTKLTQYVAVGPAEGNVSVSNLVMYAVLVPGSDGATVSGKAAVYAQKIERP